MAAPVIAPAADWLAEAPSPADQDDRTWFLDHGRRLHRLAISRVRVTRRDGATFDAAWPGGELEPINNDAFGEALFAIAEHYAAAAKAARPRRRSILRLFNVHRPATGNGHNESNRDDDWPNSYCL